jgi:predicted NBD/HSP70 family sugar kinase
MLDPSAKGKTPEDLLAAADAGDAIARRVLREAGTRLGHHVATLVNIFNPEAIVFGGEGVRFGGHLFDALREAVNDHCYPGAPPISIGWDDSTSWARGAAALAIQHFFNFEATGGYAPKTEGATTFDRVA